MTGQITTTQLSNGLRVLLKEIHTAPIISSWMWYRVGSRNENPGKTGISHWVEHMQFKGTRAFPGGKLDKLISREGGTWNAFTYLDWTTYFETLPKGKIELALDLEADRMVNSLFDQHEVESERSVIISEREGNENEPLFRLGEAIQKSAFTRHPYRYEVLGEKADLQTIQRDDLLRHYKDNYTTTNALLAAAGDFDSDKLLNLIQMKFSPIKTNTPPAVNPVKEPPMKSEKHLVVNGPGETAYIQIAYCAPAGDNPDFMPYTVVDSLLAGPSGLNMFGGGSISNKTSRLYRALVDKQLAIGVGGGIQATIDPFLYVITITVNPRHKPETVLAAFDQEIDRLLQQSVSPGEVARAIKQARALFAYGSESITNQAFWLGYSEMFARYSWFSSYLERLADIKPTDAYRICQQYLRKDARVVGFYLPDSKERSV
ncbi:MAG: insulinase family protein [Anaerolineaceae bacterium]|nr:insulinase family protein [Anaerolineaceae bacterium]